MTDVAGFITDFADQAVVLPVCLCAVAGLLLAGWRRGAVALCLATGAVMGAMLMLKLLAAGCGVFLPYARITSPSGHTAASAVVYGGGLALVLRRFLPPVRAALLGSVPVVIVVGLTRLILHSHTPAEILLGGVVGVAGVTGLVFMAGRPPHGLHPWRVALAGLVVMLLLHGTRLPAEQQIRWAALNMWPFSACHGAIRPGAG